MVMRHGKADIGSGKTYYNRVKQPGQSWTKLRDEAKKRGTFYQEVGTARPVKPRENEDIDEV